jgi:hypothetical protein
LAKSHQNLFLFLQRLAQWDRTPGRGGGCQGRSALKRETSPMDTDKNKDFDANCANFHEFIPG